MNRLRQALTSRQSFVHQLSTDNKLSESGVTVQRCLGYILQRQQPSDLAWQCSIYCWSANKGLQTSQ